MSLGKEALGGNFNISKSEDLGQPINRSDLQ
jgi:hypothetical protein